jgi:hypothetical protein
MSDSHGAQMSANQEARSPTAVRPLRREYGEYLIRTQRKDWHRLTGGGVLSG